MTARTEAEFSAFLDRSEARLLRHDAKWDAILGRREDAAAEMLGELCREGRPVHYINLRDRAGRLTGKTKEGSRHDLIAYLVRNRYV